MKCIHCGIETRVSNVCEQCSDHEPVLLEIPTEQILVAKHNSPLPQLINSFRKGILKLTHLQLFRKLAAVYYASPMRSRLILARVAVAVVSITAIGLALWKHPNH